jgi:hypothetical protein
MVEHKMATDEVDARPCQSGTPVAFVAYPSEICRPLTRITTQKRSARPPQPHLARRLTNCSSPTLTNPL